MTSRTETWAEAEERHIRTIIRLRAALKEISELGDVRADEACQIARRTLNDEQKSNDHMTVCGQCETQVAFGACCPTCGKPTDE